MDRLRVLLENWIEPKLRLDMKRAGREGALEFTRGGIGRVEAIAMDDYRKEMAETLRDLYSKTVEVVLDKVQDTAKNIGLTLEFKGKFELDRVREMTVERFNAHALEQSKWISQTMKDEIAMVIEDGLVKGLDEKSIGKNIVKHVDGMTPWQANRIARTETLMATSRAQDDFIDQIDDLPPMAKEWNSRNDGKVRRSHKRVEPVLKNHLFQVGRYGMEYPGDPSGPIEEVVNCRCVTNYVPADQLPELMEEARQRIAEDDEEED